MSKTLIIDKAVMMEEIRQLVAEGMSATITVKGNSMNPFIVDGRDRITLGPFATIYTEAKIAASSPRSAIIRGIPI